MNARDAKLTRKVQSACGAFIFASGWIGESYDVCEWIPIYRASFSKVTFECKRTALDNFRSTYAECVRRIVDLPSRSKRIEFEKWMLDGFRRWWESGLRPMSLGRVRSFESRFGRLKNRSTCHPTLNCGTKRPQPPQSGTRSICCRGIWNWRTTSIWTHERSHTNTRNSSSARSGAAISPRTGNSPLVNIANH